ncbi:Thioredoxin domain-containing protein 5 [Cucumispora dikerogammari]|nr:Thioredoxin domain-containing protein 5 [Cucumispora dikerogammari]
MNIFYLHLLQLLFFKAESNQLISLPSLPPLPIDRISFIKYSKPNCPNCQATIPHFSELKERLKTDYRLRLRTIDCSIYNCLPTGIKHLPTFILYEGDKEIGRLPGMRTYESLADFLLGNTNIDKESLIKIKHSDGVITLYERDFYSSFNGPWVILFYEDRKDPFRQIFLNLIKKYLGKVNIAEIEKKNAQNVLFKYNIKHFPSIIAFNEGIQAYYLNGYNEKKLESFINSLIQKSFQSLNFDEFNQLSYKSLLNEPIFILLYKNLSLANKLMKEKAHNYKMKTTIYKSNDQKLFEKMGYFPSENEVLFFVYKNGNFFKYNENIENEDKLNEWIFHSHFPNLTSINNDNFVQVFHGYKPVVLLLTSNEQFNKEFESVVNKLSHGMPYLNVLFGSLNVDEFPEFISGLLPGIKIPSVVIYETKKKVFFYKKLDLDKRLLEGVVEMIKEFREGKLKGFLERNRFGVGFKAWGLIILLICVVWGAWYNNYSCRDEGEIQKHKE